MWASLLGRTKRTPEPSKSAASSAGASAPPPLAPEELKGNLSLLERELNEQMKCPAGKNQVFIRSLVTVNGPTPPRIALKCSLRRDIGQKPDVFLDHIRGVCCNDPNQCEAYRRFKDRLVPT